MSRAAHATPMPKTPTDGARLFAAFLADNGISNVTASVALGVSDPTIHEWKNGTKRPIPPRRDAIAVWTKGEVPAESWLHANETIPGAGVVPFERPSQGAIGDADATGPREAHVAANDDGDGSESPNETEG